MTPTEASHRFIVGQTVWFWTPTRRRLTECVLMRHDAELDRWEAEAVGLDTNCYYPARWIGIATSDLHETRDDALRDEACRVLSGDSPAEWWGPP
jgi:hypothetical protein